MVEGRELPENVAIQVKGYELSLTKTASWEFRGRRYARYTVRFATSSMKVPVALVDRCEAILARLPEFSGWTPIPTRDFRSILLRRED